MMHRCSSSQGNMVGPCSCGLFHHHSQSNCNSFSMLFSMAAPSHKPYEYDHDQADMYGGFTSSSSPSVDCTLSLGTPSTRLSNESEKRVQHHDQRRSSSCMSNFCWDILQSSSSKHNTPSSASTHKSHRGSNSSATNSGGDPLLARRCANCDTTSTPLWRNGPRGPKSLCNACGIRFKKEERRATAAAATNGGGGGGGVPVNSSWVHHQYSQAQRMPCLSSAYGNEFRFLDDDERDADTGIPFLSWRFNVTDRPSLVHDFTR